MGVDAAKRQVLGRNEQGAQGRGCQVTRYLYDRLDKLFFFLLFWGPMTKQYDETRRIGRFVDDTYAFTLVTAVELSNSSREASLTGRRPWFG